MDELLKVFIQSSPGVAALLWIILKELPQFREDLRSVRGEAATDRALFLKTAADEREADRKIRHELANAINGLQMSVDRLLPKLPSL